MNNAREICSFEKDFRLYRAYDAYVKVTDLFKARFKKPPACELFIGALGEKDTQRSTLTARWDDKKDALEGALHALKCQEYFNEIYNNE